MLQIDRIASPVGEIMLVVDDGQLCALDFDDAGARLHRLLRRRYPDIQLEHAPDPCGFSSRLRAYLEGDLTSIDAIPVRLDGTPFQQQVWAALRRIPPGETRSYGTLAAQLGRPNAARAVGSANALNPVSIVVPCHRLVGANAALTGYGGGLERKRWLLAHEGANLVSPRRHRDTEYSICEAP